MQQLYSIDLVDIVVQNNFEKRKFDTVVIFFLKNGRI